MTASSKPLPVHLGVPSQPGTRHVNIRLWLLVIMLLHISGRRCTMDVVFQRWIIVWNTFQQPCYTKLYVTCIMNCIIRRPVLFKFCLYATFPNRPYLSSLTRAWMPPDLKIAARPCRWYDKLWREPAVQRRVSRSFVLVTVWISVDIICGEFTMANRLASFFDSWCTIMAAWPTTTWSSSLRSFVNSGIALDAKSESSYGSPDHN